MVFCNLIGSYLPEVIERKFGKDSGVPLRIATTEALEEYGGVAENVCVQYVDGEIQIRHANGSTDENLFSLSNVSLDSFVLPPIKKRKKKIKDGKEVYVLEDYQADETIWADVQDTPENPAIIVICKSLHMVNGIKSYVKLLNVNEDYIVAMLVYGAIGFEDNDLQVMFMSRSLPAGVSVERRDSKRINAEKLNDFLLLKDSNGYKYNMDMTISAILESASDSTSVRALKSECLIFDPQSEVRAKAVADAVAEKARKEEELKAQKAAKAEAERLEQERIIAEKREIEKIKEEARRAAAKSQAKEKAAATRAAKKAEQEESSEIKTEVGSSRNAGAEFFLAMLGKC